MIIRRAILKDAPQMCDILNDVIAIGGTTAFMDPVDPSFFTVRGMVHEEGETFAHLAEVDGLVQGYQWISPYEGTLCQIATFARPGTTQRGIGTALFPHTTALAKARGYDEIDATIRADNIGGLAYYSKMGFVDVGVTRDQPLGDGTLVDRIHKRLKL